MDGAWSRPRSLLGGKNLRATLHRRDGLACRLGRAKWVHLLCASPGACLTLAHESVIRDMFARGDLKEKVIGMCLPRVTWDIGDWCMLARGILQDTGGRCLFAPF